MILIFGHCLLSAGVAEHWNFINLLPHQDRKALETRCAALVSNTNSCLVKVSSQRAKSRSQSQDLRIITKVESKSLGLSLRMLATELFSFQSIDGV